jgi:hypothetical protein
MRGRANKPKPYRGLSPSESAGLIVIVFALVITAILAVASIALLGVKTTALILGCFAAGFVVREFLP